MTDRLVIGTRGSKLALAQAEWVRTNLARLNPAIDIHLELIRTSGDLNTQPLSIIGGRGVFTKELEEALLHGRIDIAVHSLKDLPTILPDRLALAAICEREDARDALVLNRESEADAVSLETLPRGAVLGTSSPRRLAQVKYLRVDIVIRDLRGNVDTRLRKLDEGQFNALILAAAGLRRLGLAHRISAAISPSKMLPAVGQGALGIETRADDAATITAVGPLNHEPTRLACLAERAFLRALGGGCQLPIAAHAVVCDQQLQLDGLVAATDGKEVIRDHVKGACVDGEKLGAELAARLLSGGANRLLAGNG